MKGPDLLKEWIEGHGVAKSKLAALVGVSRGALHEYLAGGYKPGRDAALAIERITDGAVPASAWNEGE